jgi:hypothetical protein
MFKGQGESPEYLDKEYFFDKIFSGHILTPKKGSRIRGFKDSSFKYLINALEPLPAGRQAWTPGPLDPFLFD